MLDFIEIIYFVKSVGHEIHIVGFEIHVNYNDGNFPECIK